jgi:hypothetical protein
MGVLGASPLKLKQKYCFFLKMEPNKIYAITFEGLLFIGLYQFTDDVHHFIDVYGLSDTTEKATFSKQCTFHGPFEPDVELNTIAWSYSTITDPSKFP